MENTFLETIVQQMDLSNTLNTVIILPNKRSKIFFEKILQKHFTKPTISPLIHSIDSFMESVAQIQPIDPIDLIFEFYTLYLQYTPVEEQQPFEEFSYWAKTFLKDCNEIDQYLIDPNYLFDYLVAIERIKNWKLENQPTELIAKHLAFWKKMPLYYQKLYATLKEKKVGYQGLIYREAEKNRFRFTENNPNIHYYFVGLNALSTAEKQVIKHLVTHKQATLFWDIDPWFLNDPYHDAGKFIREYCKEWGIDPQTLKGLHHNYSQLKNIHITGTPKSIGQAIIAGNIIEKIASTPTHIESTALVLPQENLLMPILNYLPNNCNGVNITMGQSTVTNPVQLLIKQWLQLHYTAQKRKAKEPVYYYKDVLGILTHPLILEQIPVDNLIQSIQVNNISYITQTKLYQLYNGSDPLFNLLFTPWVSVPQVLQHLTQLLLYLKETFTTDSLIQAYLYAIYKVINQISNYQSKHNQINSFEVLMGLYNQLITYTSIAFEGEPLEGLQIMGILETRALDFKTVIITSLNEGVLPADSNTLSFIPLDVRKEVGLPTYKDTEAIFSYHFYRLISKAKDIYLLYNTESNEGIDSGEPSRFITQLRMDPHPKHLVTHQIYQPQIPLQPNQPIQIEKTPEIRQILKNIATQKGLSPTFLTAYIRNPIDFYTQKILRINERDEVEETLELNTLGTIIHKTLEHFYKPFINQVLTVYDIEGMIKQTETTVKQYFAEVYKEGNINKGKNLLSFEVAKRTLTNFLQQEKHNILVGDEVIILALEASYTRELYHEEMPYPVKLYGNIDRIELRNNVVRIIDYKTGKVDKSDISLTTFEGITLHINHEKAIQLLCYAYLYEPHTHYPIQAGIISFKNLSQGYMPLQYNKQSYITPEILNDFTNELVGLILQLLDEPIPFTEPIEN